VLVCQKMKVLQASFALTAYRHHLAQALEHHLEALLQE
jgi:hypothetical protein